jgi:hypothetical protein
MQEIPPQPLRNVDERSPVHVPVTGKVQQGMKKPADRAQHEKAGAGKV